MNKKTKKTDNFDWIGELNEYNELERTILQKKCKIIPKGDYMKDYRLDYIKIKNYKLFDDEVELSFQTDREFHNDNTAEIKVWDSKTKNKIRYKKIIGIWGKNASGKSSVLSAFELWQEIFIKFNTFDQNYVAVPRNNDQYLMGIKVNQDERYKKIADFTYFNNPKEPVEIELGFSTYNLSFSYRLSEMVLAGSTEHFSQITEELNIWDSDKKIFSWKGITGTRKIFNIALTIKNIVNSPEFEKMNSDEEKEQYVLKSIVSLSLGKMTEEDARKFWDNYQEINKAYEIMTDFNTDSLLLKVHTISGSRTTDIVGAINNVLTMIHINGKVDTRTIENVINRAVKSLDDNATEVVLDYPINNNVKTVRMFCIKNKNDNSYIPEQLSVGTLFFLLVLVNLWAKNIYNKQKNLNEVKYLFIDELGANWHSNLTEQFLNMISDDVFGKTIIVFTSHDAEVGNNIPSDSINVITKNRQIVKANDGSEESDIRKNFNFSKRYLDDALDTYNSNPDIIAYEELKGIINKDDK